MSYSNRLVSITMVFGLFLVDVVWLYFSHLRFDWSGVTLGISAPGLLLFVAWFYTYLRPADRIANLSIDAAILIIFSHLGCIFSYLVTASGGALQDEMMVAIDRSLGFDWHQYSQFFLQNTFLRAASIFFYNLTLLLVVLTVVWFSLIGRTARSREFLSTIILGAILCIGLSGFIPTAGGAGHYAPGDDFYLGYKILVDRTYMQDFFDLRSGAEVVISLAEPKGLISFPSYHTCMAILVILAFRGQGVLFWLMLVLNLGVILSTPVEGGHHLSDVLGGVVAAFAAFELVRRLTADLPRSYRSSLPLSGRIALHKMEESVTTKGHPY